MGIVRQYIAHFYAGKFVTLNTYKKLLKEKDNAYQLQIKLPMHTILLYAPRRSSNFAPIIFLRYLIPLQFSHA